MRHKYIFNERRKERVIVNLAICEYELSEEIMTILLSLPQMRTKIDCKNIIQHWWIEANNLTNCDPQANRLIWQVSQKSRAVIWFTDWSIRLFRLPMSSPTSLTNNNNNNENGAFHCSGLEKLLWLYGAGMSENLN